MDFSKLKKELGWNPRTNLAQGLRKTVAWYLANRPWCEGHAYRGERLGQAPTKAAGNK